MPSFEVSAKGRGEGTSSSRERARARGILSQIQTPVYIGWIKNGDRAVGAAAAGSVPADF